LEIVDAYKNQRDLWDNLNPNSVDLEKLSPGQQRSFLDNRIGRYFNVVKPGGIKTELGNFYFCKHPDYLPGLIIPKLNIILCILYIVSLIKNFSVVLKAKAIHINLKVDFLTLPVVYSHLLLIVSLIKEILIKNF